MNIVLGVTGGISAYKACDIISGLKATGHTVKVIMTENAKRFITEESLAVISEHSVFSDTTRDMDGKILHTDLAHWANAFVIAPATANTISKIKNLYADNLLTTFALVFEGPFFIAPAMNPKMYAKMVETIDIMNNHSRYTIIYPVHGKMACGDVGMGKLPKPRDIVEKINLTLNAI